MVDEASFYDVLDPVCIGLPTVSGSGAPWAVSIGFTCIFQISINLIGIDLLDFLTCLVETVLLDIESFADSGRVGGNLNALSKGVLLAKH